ncbi:DNA polymerase III, gamma subunit, domain III [Dillenia turbinata]|uniref:DNA polymerase III, gamma subunit, domain III n=1 Tax=Dillenia turbinata TaxID=194707 RepID=A0AAN8UHY7_9MAGN
MAEKEEEIRKNENRNMQLKKELTAIRKAARVLRDPGTTSSWKNPSPFPSPFTPTRSVNNDKSFSKAPNGKENRVFLYNWNVHSSSEKSSPITAKAALKSELQRALHGQCPNRENDGSSSSASSFSVVASVEENVDEDENEDEEESLTNNNNDSKSDTCIAIGDLLTRRRPIKSMAAIKKKKSRRKSSTAASSKHQTQIVLPRISKRGGGFSMADDSVDPSEEYCNSEDFHRRGSSAASPLLSGVRYGKSTTILRNIRSRREDSSYSYSTPALSTSSYNRYGIRNQSTAGSWEMATPSLSGLEDDDHLDLPGRQGCGIGCYWSRRTPSTSRHMRFCGSCCSPSLSDTLRRKGSSIFCGSHSMYSRHRTPTPGCSNRRPTAPRSAQGILPLLTNSSMGTGNSDDELSTNFGELDLEALSRLDGRRWSLSCRSQEGLELVALNGEVDEEGSPENIKSLSQKYRPMFFEELIGQNIVVQSLMNSILRNRIAPIYLFQGPRGTGKTSTARIFAAALNCGAKEEAKPCGYCRDCTELVSGRSKDLWEVDATNKKGIDKVRYILKNLLGRPPVAFSRYKVFVIDECHLLPAKTWLAFLKFLEEPPPRVLFVFITTDLDHVPRTVQSRCQKYLFNKIKDVDIAARLRKISADENLDVESDALELIALNADGSLRDAETMLDQLCLLGKRITASLVNELVGVVSDEKLLELLELAMSSDTAETVKRARELMDSGVDPMVLMSQLASLIMDIIAGTYPIVDARSRDSFFRGRNLTEAEVERLKQALKLLSEAEKHLRVSSERSTWFTATLLQLGSVSSHDTGQASSSRRQSSRTTEEYPSGASREAYVHKQKLDSHHLRQRSCPSFPKDRNGNSPPQGDTLSSKPALSLMNGSSVAVSHGEGADGKLLTKEINNLDDIWCRCIEKCHSKTLRLLLHMHGKLLSLAEGEGVLVAYVAFGDVDIKARAERFQSSITNSFEIVLRRNVEIRIILLPESETSILSSRLLELADSLGHKQIDTRETIDRERKVACSEQMNDDSNRISHQETLKVSRGSINDSKETLKQGNGDCVNSSSPMVHEAFQSGTKSQNLLAEKTAENDGRKEKRPGISMQRIESIIHEQRLETAWLQATEKGTPGSMNCMKPERNQILPQDGVDHENEMESMSSLDLSSQLNHDNNVLKKNDGKVLQNERVVKNVDHLPKSPSLLHDSSFVANFHKDSLSLSNGPLCVIHEMSYLECGIQLFENLVAAFQWFYCYNISLTKRSGDTNRRQHVEAATAGVLKDLGGGDRSSKEL